MMSARYMTTGALAAAGILCAMAGPRRAAVSAFAPSAFVGPTSLGRSSFPSSAVWSSVAEEVADLDAAEAEAESAAASTEKPKRKKRRASKSTKVTPDASASSANSKVGKRRKGGKSGKRRYGKRSNKSALRRSKDKDELLPLSSLRLGQSITGYVAGITDFGAFVKTGYKLKEKEAGYALLHISQISDERVDNMADVLEVGQKLEGLRVTSINYARGEVGLSLRPKRPQRFPLSVVRRGEEMEGKVKALVPYGAFVDVGCKVNALLHVSRMSTDEVKNVEDVVKEGDYVKVRIIDVDTDKRTMACSILDEKADDYLDRRRKQTQQTNRKGKAGKSMTTAEKEKEDDTNKELQTELKYFEEALQELEDAFKE